MFTVSCPRCSATYQLDETKIGPNGRKLKCAKCGEIWVATPPVAEEAAVGPAPVAEEVAAQAAAAGTPEARAEAVEERVEAVAVADLATVGKFPLVQWVTGHRLWTTLGIALVVLGIGGGAYVFWPRQAEDAHLDVKKLAEALPDSQKVVEAPAGVVMRDAQASFSTDEKEGIAFEVSGVIENQGKAEVALPGLQVELLNAEGQVTDVWPARIDDPELGAGENTAWRVKFSNPDVHGLSGWRAVFVE